MSNLRQGDVASGLGLELDIIAAVVIGGAASLVVAAVWSVWFPSIRQVDRFEDLPAGDAATVLGATAE